MREADELLFGRVKQGDSKAIEQVYLKYRDEFFGWAKTRFMCSFQDLEDVWQETIIIFFENVKNQRLSVLRSSLSTYLFTIGRNILLNKIIAEQRINLVGNLTDFADPIEDIIMYNFDKSEQEPTLTKYFEALGSKCKELLLGRYYLGKSVDVIRQETGLNSNNVVSASLSRCLNRLKDLIKNNNSNK